MIVQKMFLVLALVFVMLGVNGTAFAEGTRGTPEILQEVDGIIQKALDAVAAGNAEETVSLIRSAREVAGEAAASYKFEFERDKVIAKLKKATKLSKKNDFSAAEVELKQAREGFANLKQFM